MMLLGGPTNLSRQNEIITGAESSLANYVHCHRNSIMCTVTEIPPEIPRNSEIPPKFTEIADARTA
jgi:hypothetical protein